MRALTVFIAATAVLCFAGPAKATTISWGTGADSHVYDGPDDTYPYVWGLVGEDISTKPLVQLIGVGMNGVIDWPDLSNEAGWFIGGDDVLLAVSSIGTGYTGYGPSGADALGRWSKVGSNVAVGIDDMIYARAWNVKKDDISTLPTLWWHFGNSGLFVIETDPDTFRTGDIFMVVPEPSLLLLWLFVGSGFAIRLRLRQRVS